jgi:hypothetical protein
VLGAQEMLHFNIISRDQTQTDFVIFKLCYFFIASEGSTFSELYLTQKLDLVYRELAYSPVGLYDNIIDVDISINYGIVMFFMI